MNLIYLFRKLVFAQVLLGIAAFCMAEPGGNPGMLLVCGALAALSWYIVEGPNGRPLPQGLIVLGALGAVGWLLVELWRGREGAHDHSTVIIAVGHFTMWLQVLQLYGRKSNRDYALILVLGLMQMVGASILSVSLLFGLLLAAYCGLALFTVLLFQFKLTGEAVLAAHQAAAPAGTTAPRPEPVAGRGHRWHFRATAAAVGAVCLATAAVVFLFMPRASRYAGDPTAAPPGPAQVGFASQVQVGGPPPTVGNREPVLNLSLHLGDAKLDEAAPRALLYLRGAALDSYDPFQHLWTRGPDAAAQDVTLDLPPQGLTLTDQGVEHPVIEAAITLRAVRARTLFAPYPAVYVDSPSLEAVIVGALDQQIAPANIAPGAVVYKVRCPVKTSSGLFRSYQRLLTPTPADGAAPWRPPPASDSYARGWTVQAPRLRRLAQQVLQEAGVARDPRAPDTERDVAAAQALQDFLRRDYEYSLDRPPRPLSDDPIADFLFHHRRGHCELFASALAAMARSIGLRARVVTGFLASEYNSIGGYYVVRQSDAHAWTEIDCGDRGWVSFDATPPAALEATRRVPHNWLTAVRQLYEHLEFSWISSVVAYDKETRQAMLARLRRSMQDAAQDEANPLGWLRQQARRTGQQWRLDTYTLAGAASIAVALALGLIVLVRLRVRRRRRIEALQLGRLPPAQRRNLERGLSFYLVMQDMLERHGYVRPEAQTPLAFAQALVRDQPRRFEPVLRLTGHFYELRFGRRPLDAARRREIRAHLRALEHAFAGLAGTAAGNAAGP